MKYGHELAPTIEDQAHYPEVYSFSPFLRAAQDIVL